MPERPSHERHRAAAAGRPVRCAVLTVSDTRTPETDTSGRLIAELLASAGHEVVATAIVPDEPELIRTHLDRLTAQPDLDAVILNGGTGIARRDRTFEVVLERIEKPIPGFGELFRMLSYEQVGAAAMLSRAVAGICGDKLLVSMPGSENAVRLATERLLLPELAHIVWELHR